MDSVSNILRAFLIHGTNVFTDSCGYGAESVLIYAIDKEQAITIYCNELRDLYVNVTDNRFKDMGLTILEVCADGEPRIVVSTSYYE